MSRDDRYHDLLRILAGDPVVRRHFPYDFTAAHLAVVAWDAEPLARLEYMAERFRRSLLAVPTPNGPVWAWLGGRIPMDADGIDDLLRWQQDRDGYVAFGEPAEGVDGFNRTHRQALEAHTIACILGERAVRWDAIALLALVAHDRVRAAQFVDAQLGPLAGPGARPMELRETLRVYLQRGQNKSAAAPVLGVHPNTVRRRLDEIRELIAPRRIEDRTAELLVALRLHCIRRI
jgi:hypothetical protein